MLGSTLKKHLKEIQRYLRSFRYERTETGLYFPDAKASVDGVYEHWVNDDLDDIQTAHNLVVDEGLNHMIDVTLLGGTALDPFYMALHSGTGTPVATTTLANYNSGFNEITSQSEGYSGANRPQWQGDAPTGNPGDASYTESINDTTPASFTIVTASNLLVNGAAIVSDQARGTYTGKMISCGKFSATRTLSNTDVFNVKYKIDLA